MKNLIFALFFILLYPFYQTIAFQTGKEFEVNCMTLSSMTDKLSLTHTIKTISNDGNLIIFNDGMSVTINETIAFNWWYRSKIKNWKKGDSIYIVFDFFYRQLKLIHSSLQDEVWGMIENLPTQVQKIKTVSHSKNNNDLFSNLTLENGFCFKSSIKGIIGYKDWEVNDQIVIFRNSEQIFQIWNFDKNIICLSEI